MLDIKTLLPKVETASNPNFDNINEQLRQTSGVIEFTNRNSKGNINEHVHGVTNGGKAMSKIFPEG